MSYPIVDRTDLFARIDISEIPISDLKKIKWNENV